MVVVAVVSGTTKPEHVVIEAARQAADRGSDVHVVYVVALSGVAKIELGLAEFLGIPTHTETIRRTGERKAASTADPILDEYETAGLIGRPVEELIRYVERVDGECVVLDANSNLEAGFRRLYQDPLQQLRENEIAVVPV